MLTLGKWKLTLPVDVNGNLTGTAADISAQALLTGYSSEWFSLSSDGGVIFSVPGTGATTSEGLSPRTELREQLQPPANNVNWSLDKRSELRARLAIIKVPASSKRIIVGQIYGYGIGPLLKLIFSRSGSSYVLQAELTSTPGGSSYVRKTLASGLQLDQKFSYAVAAEAGRIEVSANGGTPVVLPVDPSWLSNKFYFKAGAYPKSNGQPDDDAAVQFFSLGVSHN